MKSIMMYLAFGFLFLFAVFLIPELVTRTIGASGFGAIDAIINYLPYIVIGSLVGLFGVIIYRSRE